MSCKATSGGQVTQKMSWSRIFENKWGTRKKCGHTHTEESPRKRPREFSGTGFGRNFNSFPNSTLSLTTSKPTKLPFCCPNVSEEPLRWQPHTAPTKCFPWSILEGMESQLTVLLFKAQCFLQHTNVQAFPVKVWNKMDTGPTWLITFSPIYDKLCYLCDIFESICT